MSTHVISVAILAMGGEGGGVLSDWLIDLAEHHGYVAQATSVPGVAQRTGATLYYLELYPRANIPSGIAPVLALSPFPGQVDLVVASELMEAGRALQRGLVNPQRTTLVISTHRVYAMTEKTAMADGRVDEDKLLAGARSAAQQFVARNFQDLAEGAGAPIGPALLGAVAATGRLPFTRAQFEAAIERSGVGVKASLRAFATAYDAVQKDTPVDTATEQPLPRPGPRLTALAERLTRDFDAAAQPFLLRGVVRLADYQDEAYASLYLDRLQTLQSACTTASPQVISEAARHLALWMSYEDVARVADLKTRRTRHARVTQEVRAQPDQVLQLHEFLHPRVEEIADTLPAPLGRWLLATDWAQRLLGRWVQHGRVVQTSSVRGFLQLYLLAGLRRWRASSLRYAVEQSRIEAWLGEVHRCLPQQPDLALEIVRLQQLIKGYSDTHQRGWQHFCSIMEALPLVTPRADAARCLASLRQAALADEAGQTLAQALQTLR